LCLRAWDNGKDNLLRLAKPKVVERSEFQRLKEQGAATRSHGANR
jgi:hypothetical protein